MTRGTSRVGFTLIELLVVIAIIAVLVGLMIPAVMKVTGLGPQATAKHEINQLSAAIAAFQQEFGVKTMPSKFVLHENLNAYNLSDPLHARSRQFLSQMFGRRLGGSTGIVNWRQRTPAPTPTNAQSYTLSGEQCLVFFLGGIQDTTSGQPGCLGFSTNPADPSVLGGTRRGPFYEFKSPRLIPDSSLKFSPVTPAIPRNGFLVYLDAFRVATRERPYVYLCDYSTNDYQADTYEVVGTSSPTTFLTAYRSAPTRYINQGGFQILCAGPDGYFGNPAGYNPSTGNLDLVGRDDLSNFQRNRLGAPQD